MLSCAGEPPGDLGTSWHGAKRKGPQLYAVGPLVDARHLCLALSQSTAS